MGASLQAQIPPKKKGFFLKKKKGGWYLEGTLAQKLSLKLPALFRGSQRLSPGGVIWTPMLSVYILSSLPVLAPSLLLTDNDLVCYIFEVSSDLNTVKSNCLLSVASSLNQQQ